MKIAPSVSCPGLPGRGGANTPGLNPGAWSGWIFMHVGARQGMMIKRIVRKRQRMRSG